MSNHSEDRAPVAKAPKRVENPKVRRQTRTKRRKNLLLMSHELSARGITAALPSEAAPGTSLESHPPCKTVGKNGRGKRSLPSVEGLIERGGGLKEMQAICRSMKSNQLRYNEELKFGLSRTFQLAQTLSSHSDSWLEFCREPFWSSRRCKPKHNKPGEALRFLVHQVVAGDNPRSARKKVYNYLSALSELAARGIKCNDVFEELCQKGGIRDLAKAFASRRAESKPRQRSRNVATSRVSEEDKKSSITQEPHASVNAENSQFKRRVNLIDNKFLRKLYNAREGLTQIVQLTVERATDKFLDVRLQAL